MKRLSIVSIAACASMLAMSPAWSSPEVSAHVVSYGTYGNGNVFVVFDQAIPESGCAFPYLELPANSPIANTTLATAALAIATGAVVKVKTDSCYNGQPSLSANRTSWFQIDKP
jgi:hypothetical protein